MSGKEDKTGEHGMNGLPFEAEVRQLLSQAEQQDDHFELFFVEYPTYALRAIRGLAEELLKKLQTLSADVAQLTPKVPVEVVQQFQIESQRIISTISEIHTYLKLKKLPTLLHYEREDTASALELWELDDVNLDAFRLRRSLSLIIEILIHASHAVKTLPVDTQLNKKEAARLISVYAHDIRNIIGITVMLLQTFNTGDPTNAGELAEKIKNQHERASLLTNDFFEISDEQSRLSTHECLAFFTSECQSVTKELGIHAEFDPVSDFSRIVGVSDLTSFVSKGLLVRLIYNICTNMQRAYEAQNSAQGELKKSVIVSRRVVQDTNMQFLELQFRDRAGGFPGAQDTGTGYCEYVPEYEKTAWAGGVTGTGIGLKGLVQRVTALPGFNSFSMGTYFENNQAIGAVTTLRLQLLPHTQLATE